MKLVRTTVIGLIAGVSVLGVVSPSFAAAPRSTATVQTHHRHHHHPRCDRDRDRDDRWCRRHHGVDAGGGGMADAVAGRTAHLGA
ncbi:hypothetical protein ABH931_001097 [Streptacidiphilus sp. MAP12-33]|uniref:hypothetical protein n=1 Tax=Streptacidiphilus sp. MAP12-33 TaxID=3156266 RepID=UPI003516973C